MKKRVPAFVVFVILFFCFGGKSLAQTSIQYHYNFGRHIYEEHKSAVPSLVTIEHFSPDAWGDNFFFVDFMIGRENMAEAYFEIARNLKFWKEPISLHLEYNGGLNQDFKMHHAYLAGVNWSYVNLSDRVNVGVSMSYRHDQGHNNPHNMQLTTTWGWTSWNGIWTLCGFFDLWTQRIESAKSGVIFLSEPQFWMNLNQFQGVHDDFNLSLGTEVKVSYNFLMSDRFFVMPTLAVKWTFN